MNGPEPIDSVIAVLASVLAMRSGIMKGTLLESLPIASSRSGNGFLSVIEKLRSSIGFISPITPGSVCPSTSRFIQRSSEAMQSSGRTGAPSCHLRPGRKVIV